MITNKSEDKRKAVKNIIAEQQKLADAAGMNLVEYLAQAEGGMLKDTMAKIVSHAHVHPKTCPPNCAFQTSLNRLKQKYEIAKSY